MLRLPKGQVLLRPAVGCLVTCGDSTASRLLHGAEFSGAEFVAESIFCDLGSNDGVGSQKSRRRTFGEDWSLTVARLAAARDFPSPCRLHLASGAEAVLEDYARETSGDVNHQRFLRDAPMHAVKTAGVLNRLSDPREACVSAHQMRCAVAAVRGLSERSLRTIDRLLKEEQSRDELRGARQMWTKLKAFGNPVAERELYRTYAETSKGAHAEDLQFLLSKGHARRLPNGRLEALGSPPA